jgi:nitrate/nitrite-specific signal transduction histidine kinase
MLNDIAIKWHENHIGDTNKMVEHHIVDANKMINMRPKEKAQDLVNKYINLTDGWVMGIENWKHKKQCALVAVDEIINALNSDINPLVNYWYEVKQEIEKL